MRCLFGRGQTGLELIVSLIMLLIVFMAVVLIVSDKVAESSRIKTLIDVRRISNSIKDNVNMIAQQGPGYYNYISIPEKLQGGYEYDVYLKNNVLELVWEDNAWSTKLATSNVTVYCISKGLTQENRILYGQYGLEVTCHLPNLKLLSDSLDINVPLGAVNTTTVDIVNDAHVHSTSFTTVLKTNNTQVNVLTDSLPAGETITLRFNNTIHEFLTIQVDYFEVVNESIEIDNNVTRLFT